MSGAEYVLMAVSFLTGAVVGWLIKRHRLALLAENNHWVGEEIEALKGADLDADVAAERALRRSGETPKVGLYDQDAQSDPDDPHGCPGCLGTLVSLDDGSRWCPRCHSFWDQVEPDGPEAVSAQVNQVEPAVGRAVMRGLSVYDEETGEQLAGPEIDCPEEGGCRRPEQCESGCYWLRLGELNRPLVEDEDFEGPRSIPGRRD